MYSSLHDYITHRLFISKPKDVIDSFIRGSHWNDLRYVAKYGNHEHRDQLISLYRDHPSGSRLAGILCYFGTEEQRIELSKSTDEHIREIAITSFGAVVDPTCLWWENL